MVLEEWYPLSSFVFNFALGYAIGKVQENQEELELNGTHQVLVYADEANTLQENKNTKQKSSQNLSNDKKSFENIVKFKYLGMTLKNQNCIHKESRSRLNFRIFANVQLRIFCFPVSSLKTLMCKTTILPGVLYKRETWFLTLREEHR
jgi:hypothetical protein